MPDPIATFRAFLDEELDAPEFERRLYQDSEIEAALSAMPAPRGDDASAGTLYLFLISLDYQSAVDLRKARRALAPVAHRQDARSSRRDFWASDFDEPNPPVTDALIRRVETLLNVKLPETYISLMREQNGSHLKSNAVSFAEPPAPTMKYYTGEGSISLGAIFGLNHDPDASGGIAQTLRLAKEWDLPEGLVLLDGDGHTWVALDYRGSKSEPSVVFHVADTGESATIADSFGDLLERLRILPEYQDDEDE